MFWRTAPPAGRIAFWREDMGRPAGVFGHKIGVFAQPVACAIDGDDDGVVEQPVSSVRPESRFFRSSGGIRTSSVLDAIFACWEFRIT